jgi:hypothetical protein
MPEHFQRLIYTNHNGIPNPTREPLHLYFDIAHGNIIWRNTGRQVVVLTGIRISFCRERRQHATDILEIFIRVPAAAHTLNIELKGFIGETFVIKDAHNSLAYLFL